VVIVPGSAQVDQSGFKPAPLQRSGSEERSVKAVCAPITKGRTGGEVPVLTPIRELIDKTLNFTRRIEAPKYALFTLGPTICHASSTRQLTGGLTRFMAITGGGLSSELKPQLGF
jgi:hypothetical protein